MCQIIAGCDVQKKTWLLLLLTWLFSTDTNISGPGWPYSHFRLSVVVALSFRHLVWTCHGRKPPFCLGNFDAVYHRSRDISTSGLGGHIAISGCRSLSQWLRNTFFDVDVVGKLDFVTWVTTILIPDLFCHSSQHDYRLMRFHDLLSQTS